jgi:predicted permease
VSDSERRYAWLFRLARLRASDEALGDVHEEFAAGGRSVFWLIRQLASTLATRSHHPTFEEGRSSMLSNLWSDVRYTLRTFRRSPGFALAAIVPIALGIGINTSLFSILNNVALRPLPTPESSELVSVYQRFEGVQKRRVHGARMMFSMPEYRAYHAGARTVSDIAAYTMPWRVTLAGSTPQDIEGILVSCNYFDVLRLRPVIGPGLTAGNCEAADAQLPIVLGHALWSTTFNSDAGIVGRTLTLNDRVAVVVGVAPPGFEGTELSRASFFMSTSFQRAYHDQPQLSWLTMLARRRPDASLAQVRAELGVIAAQIDSQQPGRSTELSVAPATALSFPFARGEFLMRAGLVLGAFSLVLLIACANVANVLLARAAGRTREIAVRLSVGASRSRLIRQLLTESCVIALAGGAAGLMIGWWSFQILLVRVFSSIDGGMSEARLALPPDLTVLWYALGLTLVTSLVCGMVPALQASKPDIQGALKREAADTGVRRAGWLRGALIAVQVAVCMVLLVSAGLLLRALHAANTLDVGFDHQQVATVSYALRPPAYDDQRAAVFQRELMERVRALPGVDAVAQVGKVPFSNGRMQTGMRLPNSDVDHQIEINHVSPEYFDILRIPLLSGRTFAATESLHGGAVIVSESTARRYWPGENPVGRTVLLEMDRMVPFEVVGVARDALVTQSAEAMASYVYLPPVATAQRGLRLLVRSRTDPGALAAGITAAVRDLDAGLVVNVARLDAGLAEWQTNSRLIALLSAGLGALALVLSAIGVYGLVAYVVTRRRREVGIRMTLGATSRDVQLLLVRQTLTPVAIGIIVGIAGAAVASSALEGSLFGVNRLDPLTFVAAALFLMSVAATAAMMPARQAVRIDPVTTLRSE